MPGAHGAAAHGAALHKPGTHGAAAHGAARQEPAASQRVAVPGQQEGSSRHQGYMLRPEPLQATELGSNRNESSGTGLDVSSAMPRDELAGGSPASLCQEQQQHHSVSALPAGSERMQPARLNAEQLLSAVPGTGQVMGQTEHVSSSGDEVAGIGRASDAMPEYGLETGERAVSKGGALSLISMPSGRHPLISAPFAEPSSLSEHAVSDTSGESTGHREHVDVLWPAGTAQHIIAASKGRSARCDELRSSGGSVGSCRASSDLSDSQYDSYQGSYPSRPESSGTQGTLDHLNRWNISVIYLLPAFTRKSSWYPRRQRMHAVPSGT